MPFVYAEAQSKHLTETFLPFLHLLNRWSSRSTAVQPGAAWSGEQLSASRLGSGFVRGGTIQHGDQRGLGKRGGTPANKTQAQELERAVRCRQASHGDRSCMSREMQAANDRTTKSCFPSAALRPSNPTSRLPQRLLLHAASLISALTCARASCRQ